MSDKLTSPGTAPVPIAPPSFSEVLAQPRGGPHTEMNPHGEVNVPPVPGVPESSNAEKHRRERLALRRAWRAHAANEAGRGVVEGTMCGVLVISGVVLGPEVAVIGAIGWLGVRLLGG